MKVTKLNFTISVHISSTYFSIHFLKNKLETFICICYSFGIILVVQAGGENNNKTLGGTKQSVVYSYSSVLKDLNIISLV